jgi:hypothetical protein
MPGDAKVAQGRGDEMQKQSMFNATGYMIAALAVIANAAAMTAEALDPELESNGPVGFVLFGVGTVAVTYLLVAALRAPVAAIARFVRRPRGGLQPIVPGWVLLAASGLMVPAAVGANVFKNHTGGTEDFLNFVSFFSFFGIILFFGVVVAGTALAWATGEAPRLPEVEVREQRW